MLAFERSYKEKKIWLKDELDGKVSLYLELAPWCRECVLILHWNAAFIPRQPKQTDGTGK